MEAGVCSLSPFSLQWIVMVKRIEVVIGCYAATLTASGAVMRMDDFGLHVAGYLAIDVRGVWKGGNNGGWMNVRSMYF